jgi:uncharacterized protein YdhG (YjbR/CyaY superfamily)
VSKPKSIDAYLEKVPPGQRAALVKLRRTILELLPDAEECISYSMPAFRARGRVVAGFLATRAGYSYFPFSGTTLGTLSKELADYDRTKSALHFSVEQPLPKRVLQKLLKARLAELDAAPRRPAGAKGRAAKPASPRRRAKSARP